MGWIVHDAVLVTVPDYVVKGEYGATPPDVDGFRASLPPEWQPLVVGPIPSVVNGDVTYAFLSDGSKVGWDTDRDGNNYRRQFAALFAPSGFRPVFVQYGELDHPTASTEAPDLIGEGSGGR